MRVFATEAGRQARHHVLQDDQAVGHVEVGAHAFDVDLETFHKQPRMRESAPR
jgi:hypothetical protein